MTAAATTKVMTNYLDDLGLIRAYLNQTRVKVQKWDQLSPNAQGNIVAHLRVATANLLGREGLMIEGAGIERIAANIGTGFESLYSKAMRLVVESLKAIHGKGLENPPAKPQPHYKQEQVLNVLDAMQKSLKSLESGPVTYENSRIMDLPENEAVLTQPRLEGLTTLTGNTWTMPLINGIPLTRGLGGLDHVFGSEYEVVGRRDHILRLENASMSVVSTNTTLKEVQLRVQQNFQTKLEDHLYPIMPRVVIAIVNSYISISYDLTTYLGDNQHCPDCLTNYKLYTSPYKTGVDDNRRFEVPVASIHSKIEEFRIAGHEPRTFGHWLGSYGWRVAGHVTLMRPVQREVMLIGYVRDDLIRVYDARVKKTSDSSKIDKEMTDVEAIGLEHMLLIYSERALFFPGSSIIDSKDSK